MKVYIIKQPADDPHAGEDYTIEIYKSKEKAEKVIEKHNKKQKYNFQKYYLLEWDVEP